MTTYNKINLFILKYLKCLCLCLKIRKAFKLPITQTIVGSIIGSIVGGLVVFYVHKTYEKGLEKERLISVINFTIFRLGIMGKDIKEMKNFMQTVKTPKEISSNKKFPKKEIKNTLRYFPEASALSIPHLKIYDIIKKDKNYMTSKGTFLLEEINNFIYNHKTLFFYIKKRNGAVRELLELIIEKKDKFMDEKDSINLNENNINYIKNKYAFYGIGKLDKNINNLIKKALYYEELSIEGVYKIADNEGIPKEKLLRIK